MLGAGSPEMLEIHSLNKLIQRELPVFFPMIGDFSKASRVYSKLARHLDLGVAKMVLLTSVDPDLELVNHHCAFFSIPPHLPDGTWLFQESNDRHLSPGRT